MKCYKTNCRHCRNQECSLEEISIGELGNCREGAPTIGDLAMEAMEELGVDNIYDIFNKGNKHR